MKDERLEMCRGRDWDAKFQSIVSEHTTSIVAIIKDAEQDEIRVSLYCSVSDRGSEKYVETDQDRLQNAVGQALSSG